MKVLHTAKEAVYNSIEERGVMMISTLMDLTERLVPISDFSQGKAGKIFADVFENNNEYIILKNNQPTAVLVSIKEYRDMQNKIAAVEKFMEDVENMRLLKMADSRKDSPAVDFEEFITSEGFTMDGLRELAESVEFE
jgi:prevent-host-death family protein